MPHRPGARNGGASAIRVSGGTAAGPSPTIACEPFGYAPAAGPKHASR